MSEEKFEKDKDVFKKEVIGKTLKFGDEKNDFAITQWELDWGSGKGRYLEISRAKKDARGFNQQPKGMWIPIQNVSSLMNALRTFLGDE